MLQGQVFISPSQARRRGGLSKLVHRSPRLGYIDTEGIRGADSICSSSLAAGRGDSSDQSFLEGLARDEHRVTELRSLRTGLIQEP